MHNQGTGLAEGGSRAARPADDLSFWRLAPLALATFAVGTDGFVIAGLLPHIARDTNVSQATAGQLVTVFALTFALTAPFTGAFTSGLRRKRALMVALSVFFAGNALAAVSGEFWQLMAGRVVAAVGAGVINSAAFSTAAACVRPGRRGQALALVMGGLSGSTALGLPVGTLIGSVDWRITLWAVAALSVVAAAGIAALLPPVSLPPSTIRERLAPVRNGWVFVILATTMLALTGTYVLYTYVGALLKPVTQGSGATFTLLLFAWGTGGVFGTVLSGRLVDRLSPGRVLVPGLMLDVILLAASPWAVAHLAAAVPWAVLWGACAALPVVPQQHKLISGSNIAAPVLIGLNSSAIYLGISAGAALGGAMITVLAAKDLGIAAAVVTLLATFLAISTERRNVR